MDLDDVQKIYVKIVAGYEEIKIGDKKCFLKHHDYLDKHLLKEKYNEGILIAKKHDIKTESDYLNLYIDKGWWSQAKEDEIRKTSSFIESLKKSKEKLILPSQKEKVSQTISEEEQKLEAILSEKRSIMPITAEEFANKYYNRFYLHKSLFLDKEFKYYFSEDENYFVEEISDSDYEQIWNSIFKVIEFLNIKNIKYVAASGFFQNLLMLTGKEMSAIDFYGKSVSCLTINQIDLFSFGSSYRRAINNATEKIPDYILNDPESLIDWCEGGNNSSGRAKDLMNKTPNKNKTKGERSGRITSIVGASANDYKKLGIGGVASPDSNLISEAENSGGQMSINQVIKKTDKFK